MTLQDTRLQKVTNLKKLELEKMYAERPELLFDGEKEMIFNWLCIPEDKLPTTYNPTFEKSTRKSITKVDYYEKN